MGNPFGKIIQNGVEYDVTPYAHKVEISANGSETYASAFAKLFAQLKANVSDLQTIKFAALHFKNINSGYHEIDYYIYNPATATESSIRLTFVGAVFNTNTDSLSFNVATFGRNCVYGSVSINGSFTNQSSNVLSNGLKIELYYS